MHVFEEPNVELLREKARVLESENTRLVRRVGELLRENLRLKGMTPEQAALNLPGLVAQAAGASTAGVTRAGSERRARSASTGTPAAGSEESTEKKPQKGHGPTPQPSLPIIEETYDLDEADKVCPTCGDALEDWEGHEDESEVIDVIERQWLVRKRKNKKYRCPRGCCMETAEAPTKLIPGGRYAPGVAVNAAVSKYLDQTPLERQVRAARRQGVRLTTQALWDQVSALAVLMTPVYDRIKALLLSRPVIGVDESPFKLVKKGGSVKWQAWQMSCPVAVYFAILPSKSAEMGSRLLATYSGTVMVDGAATYTSLAKDGSFVLVNCWSHARRTVLAAEGEAPGQVAEFLDLVGELYAIERMAAREPEPGDKRRGYRHRIDHEKLRALRDTESRKVVARIQKWILEQKCIPGGKLKASLEYIAKRWKALTRFLDDPLIPLDNNQTEAGYIGLAIGRRNYIGARSVLGTEVAAKFYTIFETAKTCGADPEAYLRYATDTALRGDTPMLPNEWSTQQV